jgi:lysine 2,3-aminomutase
MFLESLSNANGFNNREEAVKTLLKDNPAVKSIFTHAETLDEATKNIRAWVFSFLEEQSPARDFYKHEKYDRNTFGKINWQEYAAIRLLDYIDNRNRIIEDPNTANSTVKLNPFAPLWSAIKENKINARPDYFHDMNFLFKQLTGKLDHQPPSQKTVKAWMNRHPSGLDPEIVKMRQSNKARILKIFIQKISQGKLKSERFKFEPGMSEEEKYSLALEWWNNSLFHLKFAVRKISLLNELLGYTLDEQTLRLFAAAQKKGIPVFINPYYLSLINVNAPEFAKNADRVIRDYIFVNRDLIEEFGKIKAWEKEDIVEPGEPNTAGWILPSRHNIHRRYPEVAIMIPDTAGRACGGLCVSCQRMYDFQRGNLNFNLEELKPKEKWPDKLKRLLSYYENDAQLRDILITGGDALMSSNRSLKLILNEVFKMAVRKKEANKVRPDGEKLAEMVRVRLGTRLPVYLPQRITDDLIEILAAFKKKASTIGFRQFVIQTHFETAMEITPEVKKGVEKLLSAGWIVTNQQVFTTAASVRGHTAKLRKTLNDIGVLTYYTFTVKGFDENKHNFATNARAIQEQMEEKRIGEIPAEYYDLTGRFPDTAENMVNNINALRKKANIPFLATDRNVLNLPGVGKSLSFRTIGILPDGRRVLEFDHDDYRNHSPITDEMGKVVIIESKSIKSYIDQLEAMGENPDEYNSLYGYSMGVTEPRAPLYEYPDGDPGFTCEYTNLKLPENI